MPPRKNAMAGVEVVHKTTRKRSFKAEAFDPEQIRSEINPFASKLPSVAKQADQHQPTLDNLAGTPILEAQRNLETVDDFSGEVIRLWGEAGRAFIETGRALNRAKERLAHGDFMVLTAQRLPFAHNIAVRLMAISRAVDDGVYPAEALPPNYTVAYQLVSLYESERPIAVKEGLVTPSVTRKAIEDFKKRMRPQDGEDEIRQRDRKRLASLIGQRARIDAEIARLKDRLGE